MVRIAEVLNVLERLRRGPGWPSSTWGWAAKRSSRRRAMPECSHVFYTI